MLHTYYMYKQNNPNSPFFHSWSNNIIIMPGSYIMPDAFTYVPSSIIIQKQVHNFILYHCLPQMVPFLTSIRSHIQLDCENYDVCATELLREREGGREGGRVASHHHSINLKEGEGKMIASPPPPPHPPP